MLDITITKKAVTVNSYAGQLHTKATIRVCPTQLNQTTSFVCSVTFQVHHSPATGLHHHHLQSGLYKLPSKGMSRQCKTSLCSHKNTGPSLLYSISFYRCHNGPMQYGTNSAWTTVVKEGQSQVVNIQFSLLERRHDLALLF